MGDIPLAIKDWDQVEQNPSSARIRIKSTLWMN
jgi:hypothetical protein